MSAINPKTPVRADHRLIKKLMSISLGGEVEYLPDEFDLIAEIFMKAGGSWEKAFQGSPSDLTKLKKVIKMADQKGYLTKKIQWRSF